MAKKLTRIAAFDPALSVCGWAIMDLILVDPKTNKVKIVVTSHGTIKAAMKANRVAYRDDTNKYGRTIISLSLLRESVLVLVRNNKPKYITIEDAFFNPKRPNAFASLIQCILTISLACKDHFSLPSFRIPTRTAKQTLTGSGGFNKLDVHSAVLNSDLIEFKESKKSDKEPQLTPHESDAIAVGYHFLLKMYPSIANNIG